MLLSAAHYGYKRLLFETRNIYFCILLYETGLWSRAEFLGQLFIAAVNTAPQCILAIACWF